MHNNIFALLEKDVAHVEQPKNAVLIEMFSGGFENNL
jgi:hypothetical protein